MPKKSLTLKKLNPVTFENLIYDLAQSVGIENLIWRTPGADGGRDIEGQFSYRDISGSVGHQKWFIECKRYQTSIDWPTVWKKIAYAESHEADFLLIATTSTLSPDCQTEVARWNESGRAPVVRAWNEYQLDYLLRQFPEILSKYGLAKSTTEKDRAFVRLAAEVSKAAQAAYATADITPKSENFALEAAAALAELLTTRMEDLSRFGSLHCRNYDPVRDKYPWQNGTVTLSGIDGIGLRAILATLRYTMHAIDITGKVEKQTIRVTANSNRFQLADSSKKLLNLIATWSNLEVNFLPNGAGVRISQRN